MKYIHIVQFHLMSGGGVGSVLTDLCEAMAKQSSEVYIFSLFQRKGIAFNDEIEWAKKHNVHVELMQTGEISQLRALVKLRWRIKELAKDDACTLFLHLKWGVLAGILSSILIKNITRIEVYHSGYMNYKVQAFCSKFFLKHYIAVSEDAKKQLIKWFGIKNERISVIYNGVDVESIRQITSTIPHFESNDILFASIGRLSPEKGFIDSIRAYSELRKNGEMDHSCYTMIGDGIERSSAEQNSKGFVEFTGVLPRNDVYKRIKTSDAIIMPSHWEGNSILLLETMAVGKALLVTDIPSFREVLKFSPLDANEQFRLERFGAIFRVQDSESCKDALRAIGDKVGKTGLRTMAEYVSQFADDFSVYKQASMYIEVANAMISN